MIKLCELGDLGDRMVLGYPMTQGGGIGGGAVDITGFSSPDICQDPAKFGTMSGKSNVVSQGKNKNLVTPFKKSSENDPAQFDKNVDRIKYKVTPDEVICGLNYELQHMVLKDSQIAKQIVIKNLKVDPQYYSKLHMLGVYPGDEDVPEDTTNVPPDDSDLLGDIAPSLFEIVHKYISKKGFKKNER